LDRKRTVLVPRSWESALEDYLVYKQSQGRRYDTLRDIRQKVNQFFRTYPTIWPSDLKRAVQDWLGEKGIKSATYNLRLSALRGFLEWAVGEGLIADNPVRGYKARPKEPRIVDIPDSVLEQLLDLPNKSRFVGLRDHALIMLTLDTGIRPQEARRLSVVHVDLDAGTVYITPEVSKTHRSRILYMCPETVRAVMAWLEVRPAVCVCRLSLRSCFRSLIQVARCMAQASVQWLLRGDLVRASHKVRQETSRRTISWTLRCTSRPLRCYGRLEDPPLEVRTKTCQISHSADTAGIGTAHEGQLPQGDWASRSPALNRV
jgi:integrase